MPMKNQPKLPAWIWQAVGIGLLSTGFVGFAGVFAAGAYIESFGVLGTMGLVGVGTFLMTAGMKCINRARRIRTFGASEDLPPDTRSPVLFLRSFADDASTSQPPDIAYIEPFIVATGEENLIAVLNEIGPVIAIGQPGEKLPRMGARRRYVAQQDWQEIVQELMHAARLVVLLVGQGQGLWWEIEQALRWVAPQRLLFLIPKSRYRLFREKVHEWIPIQLPEPKAVFPLVYMDEYLLYFQPDGQPCLTRPRNYALVIRGNLTRPLVPTYKLALRPVFEQLGVEWSPPPIPWKVYAIIFAIVTILAGGLYLIARIAPTI
ncbi:MAG: hypothetical protein PVG19_02095 [Desulfobacterales bacterium]|jgi:hypothetical protein